MSDFGAGACDFHSDFASDFRTEGNDYASDFRDFPGDFGGEPRTARPPHRQGHRGTRTAASWQRKRQAATQGTTPRHKATNKGHRTRGATEV